MRQSSPLNPPILGDFEFEFEFYSPPELGAGVQNRRAPPRIGGQGGKIVGHPPELGAGGQNRRAGK